MNNHSPVIGRSNDERIQQRSLEEPPCNNISSTTTKADAASLSTGNSNLLFENIVAMKLAENSSYLHRSYFDGNDDYSEEFPIWRENICNWKYSVIDHYRLSRRTVAVSMNIFDRFLATLCNKYGKKEVLLISLSALFVSIKIHERTEIQVCIMTDLSGNQFSSKEIKEMELKILQNTRWLVHPPVPFDFVSLLLKLLPNSVMMPVRYKLFESVRYLVELSVCGHFFVGLQPSIIAFAAILNVLEDDGSYGIIPQKTISVYLANLRFNFQFDPGDCRVRAVRHHLRGVIPTQDRSSPCTICHDA